MTIFTFRPSWSREYQDTYPFPPPATVYGMILSLIGIEWHDKSKFAGMCMAIAMQGEPDISLVFRKFRRVPQSKKNADPLTERRPDYQDLLIGLKLWLWISDGNAEISIVERVRAILTKPYGQTVSRYGGLSLGESSHLVNEISIRTPSGSGRFLCRDNRGYYHLPVWVHHPRSGEGKTKLARFSILDSQILEEPMADDPRWIPIEPA